MNRFGNSPSPRPQPEQDKPYLRNKIPFTDQDAEGYQGFRLAKDDYSLWFAVPVEGDPGKLPKVLEGRWTSKDKLKSVIDKLSEVSGG